VPEFLVQSYVADPEQAIAAVGRARWLRSPELLRTIVVPGDEVVLALWRASDPDAVCAATLYLGLPADRISLAEEVSP
jgi:hypothetical protein